jgi:hypothetical protein
MSNNVISFPKKNVKSENVKIEAEEIQNNLDMMRYYHIQEAILNMAPLIFNQLDIAGFGLADDMEEDVRDGAFLIEALRAMMFKHYGMYHPFHTLVDHIFEEKLTEEGSYKIVDSINLDLTEPEETETE